MYQDSDSWRVGLRQAAHVDIFVFRNGDEPHLNNVQLGRFGRRRKNVQHYPGANKSELGLHPTVKPSAMATGAILDSTALNDIVLDPYRGSGTTVLAAERAGRRRRGIKLDPLHVDTAILRWEAFTGQQARDRGVAL
jgi:DNA modification methylase